MRMVDLAAFIQIAKQAKEMLPDLRIECGRRFVQNEKIRFAHQSPRDKYSLLLSSGKLPDQLVLYLHNVHHLQNALY